MKRKHSIKPRKGACIIILSILNLVFLGSLVFTNFDLATLDEVLLYSKLGVMCLIINLIVWKAHNHRILCPYVFFYLALAVFCLGQSYAWGLGLLDGERNLLYSNPYGSLLYSIVYSINALNLINFGACIVTTGSVRVDNTVHLQEDDNENKLKAFSLAAKIIFYISIVPFIIKSFLQVATAYVYGYGDATDDILGNSSVGYIIQLIANMFMPALVVLLGEKLILKRNDKFLLIICIISTFPTFYTGGRSPGVMMILAIFSTYILFKQDKIKWTSIIFYLVMGYIALVIISTIKDFRYISGKTVSSFFKLFGDHFVDAVKSILYELGWNLSSLVYTKNVVPSYYNYKYGLSYFWGLLNGIPNVLGQWGDNVNKYSALSDWLTNLRNTGSGTGYTLIAETYINFGSFGLTVNLLWGFLVGKYLHKDIYKTEGRIQIVNCFMILLFLSVVLKSLVRSDISNTIRTVLYSMLPFYIIYRLLYHKLKVKQNRKRG